MAIDKIESAGLETSTNQPNFRNIIINGDMSQAQRATSAASLTGSSYATVDRFKQEISSQGTWTQSQSTTVPTGQGFSTSLKMDCTTADASPAASDYIFITQKIEAQNLQYLKKGTSSAEQLTLSFWVRSNKTGTYIARLRDADNSRSTSKSYTISSADTWEKKTITYDADTTGTLNNDNGTGLQLYFYLGAGTDYTSGSLATTWESNTNANNAVGQVNLADSTSNEWYVTGVQLEAGTSASDFEFLPVDVNLRRCQRYYMRWQGDTSDQRAVANGMCVANNQVRIVVISPVTLRGIPTVTESDLENLDSFKGTENVSLNATIDPGVQGVNLQLDADSGTPFTQHRPTSLRVKNLAASFLALDSEL